MDSYLFEFTSSSMSSSPVLLIDVMPPSGPVKAAKMSGSAAGERDSTGNSWPVLPLRTGGRGGRVSLEKN